MNIGSNTSGNATQRLTSTSPEVRKLRNRLERWELPHLRELAAQQAAQIEQLQAELDETKRQLHYAEDCAEQWREQTMQALNDAVNEDPERLCIGLSRDGRVAVMVNTAPTPHDFGTHAAFAA